MNNYIDDSFEKDPFYETNEVKNLIRMYQNLPDDELERIKYDTNSNLYDIGVTDYLLRKRRNSNKK